MEPSTPDGNQDNITDWCLTEFRTRYNNPHITKDDIWEYLYGIMHAPDWRNRYRHDLQRNLPRIPLAADFETFRTAGRKLMDLHVGYETCPEWDSAECLVDGFPDTGTDPEAYRIQKQMKWNRTKNENSKWETDHTELIVNNRCRLINIPPEAQQYTVSGRSPLDWAIVSLRHKLDKPSGITDDPNRWHQWEHTPYELIRHLRRLIYVSVTSARIIAGLPPSLDDQK